MLERDRAGFYEVLANISEFYPKPISDKVYALWFETLKRFDLEAITQGFTLHLNDTDSGQFLPKPADIIKHIEGGKSDRSSFAWSKVESSIRKVGPYATIVFDDWIIHRVLEEMGGWIAISRVDNDELPFKANEFQKRYQGYVLRNPENYPKVLSGIATATNSAAGYDDFNKVMAIGDRDKARLVWQGGGEHGITMQTLGDVAAKTAARLVDNQSKEVA